MTYFILITWRFKKLTETALGFESGDPWSRRCLLYEIIIIIKKDGLHLSFLTNIYICDLLMGLLLCTRDRIETLTWLKKRTDLMSLGDLQLLPAPQGPACHLHGSYQFLNCSPTGWKILIWSKMNTLGNTESPGREVKIYYLIFPKIPYVAVNRAVLWILHYLRPMPFCRLPDHTQMWWKKDTWGRWNQTTEDILSSDLKVRRAQVDLSGIRAMRISKHWRSLLVKLHALDQARKGWYKI